MTESELERIMRAALAAEDPLSILSPLGADGEVHTAREAAAVAEFVTARRQSLLDLSDKHPWPLLSIAAGLFRSVQSREAFDILAARGLPALRGVFDELIDREWGPDEADTLLIVVQVFALYRFEEDLPRIARAARHPSLAESHIWAGVFHAFDEQHPLRRDAAAALARPLPLGFAGIAYLDFANTLAREESFAHPFDDPEGVARLEGLLTDPDPGRSTYAHSAAAALPFISEPARGRLLALAFDHPSERVQLEAGWASAKLGSRAGVDFLARLCLDPRYSAVAVEYLQELGEMNAVPARAMSPDFRARAEMCRWLAHPLEFGSPPDEAEVIDTRTLVWPPANEPRRMHLVKYVYRGRREDRGDEVGIGLVGSITFALFGETNPQMPPEDLYALHCCWELEAENDPRTPAKRTAEAGRELLRKAGNAGF